MQVYLSSGQSAHGCLANVVRLTCAQPRAQARVLASGVPRSVRDVRCRRLYDRSCKRLRPTGVASCRPQAQGKQTGAAQVLETVN